MERQIRSDFALLPPRWKSGTCGLRDEPPERSGRADLAALPLAAASPRARAPDKSVSHGETLRGASRRREDARHDGRASARARPGWGDAAAPTMNHRRGDDLSS